MLIGVIEGLSNPIKRGTSVFSIRTSRRVTVSEYRKKIGLASAAVNVTVS